MILILLIDLLIDMFDRLLDLISQIYLLIHQPIYFLNQLIIDNPISIPKHLLIIEPFGLQLVILTYQLVDISFFLEILLIQIIIQLLNQYFFRLPVIRYPTSITIFLLLLVLLPLLILLLMLALLLNP